MSYTRQYPGGVPVGQVISSGNFEYWDISISTAIDGTGGGVYDGPVILTNTALTDDSYVDITGDVACANVTASVSVNTVDLFVSDDAAFGDDVEISGILTVLDAILVTSGSNRIEADRILVNRILCASPGTQSIDCSTGTQLALNFITDDTWEITLSDSSDPTTCAILSTTVLLTDTSGTANLRVKHGSKITITFRAATGQIGGIGLSPGIFPASFLGIRAADLIGPRTGEISESGGASDWIRMELENIGTETAPLYSVAITMGGSQ
jgi:hypothetical protein